MTRKDQVRYEMLLRVRDFGATHRETFPEHSPAGQMFATVGSIVSDIDTHATNKVVMVHEAHRLKVDRRRVMLGRMRAIARTSRGIHTETGSALRLVMPDRTSDVAIVRGARAFLLEVEPYQTQLVSLGLPAACLPQLREAADAFEAAMTERRTGRSGVAGARAGIKAALARGGDAARTLDIMVTNATGNDPVVTAAWNRDRRLVEGKGKGRGKTDLQKAS